MVLPNRLNEDELEQFGFEKVSPYKASHKRYNSASVLYHK